MGESRSRKDSDIEIWKIKRLIKSLESVRGNGTSMISLIIPPKYQILRMMKMLTDEFGKASHIKSKTNRASVHSAIASVQQRLRLYPNIPTNGLVIYSGTVIAEDNKPNKINIDFEPFKPINTSLYLCDNKFHTEPLRALVAPEDRFGLIVIDGNGVLIGTLEGNVRQVLYKYSVDLPKKHSRGGQSAVRFERLRIEKRHNYVQKVAETALHLFTTSEKVNISGLIVAGSGDLKTVLTQPDVLDSRLRAKVIKLVDLPYGGETGFIHAIDLASDSLQNLKYIQEKILLNKFFKEVSLESRKYCFGVENTLSALEQGAVETLICLENLDIQRYVMKSHITSQEVVLYVTPEQEAKKSYLIDKNSGIELDEVEKQLLLEWFADNYKKYGAKFVIATDKSPEGNQFVKGFGGIGGILRYKIDFESLQMNDDNGLEVYDVVEM